MARINQGILVKAYTKKDGQQVDEHYRNVPIMQKNIERFLTKFPDEARSWRQATDEVRDLSNSSRIILEEEQNIVIDAVNFRAINSPSEWNRIGKASILNNFSKMNERSKQRFYERHQDWFGKITKI